MAVHWLGAEPDDDRFSVDDATQIGRQMPARVSARRISRVDGVLRFMDEVPMECGTLFRDLDYLGRDGEHRRAEILRTEYKVPSGNACPLRTGDKLHIAFLPYTRLLCLTVSFKGARHRSRAERADDVAAGFETDDAALVHVETLSHDLWEQGKYLTAGFSQGPGRAEGSSRGSWRGGHAVLGLSPADIDVGHALQVSPCVQRLLRWSEDGPFPFRRGLGLRLHPGVQERAEHWMDQAVEQTLAGPIDNHRTARDFPPGTPIERLLIRRYRNLLIGAHRDLAGSRRTSDTGSGRVDGERLIDWASYRKWDEDHEDEDLFVSLDDIENGIGLDL